jgi:hypothetical protein
VSAYVNRLPCSLSLRAEFQALAPNKSTAQNGAVGDLAHILKGTSDHLPDEETPALRGKDADKVNEVHAADEDSRGTWPKGWSMQRCIDIIVNRCRAGIEKRLRYIIFNGYIWEASNSWKKRKYDGDDQHTTHAHFSFVYGSGSGTSNPENDKSPWGFLAAYRAENIMATLDKDDVKAVAEAVFLVAKDRVAPLPGQTKQATAGGILWALDSNIRQSTATILAAIKAINPTLDVDEAALARELLANMPADLAKQVVDEYVERLSA